MAKLYNITSANSSVSALTPVGSISFEGYSTDRKWTQEFVEYIERERSADGKLVLAFVPQLLDIRFTFSSASPTLIKLSELDMMQKIARAPLPIPSLTITLPSIGMKFQCINGAMFGMPAIPAAAKKLESVEVGFTFDEIVPMPI